MTKATSPRATLLTTPKRFIFAIDPGDRESAYAVLDTLERKVIQFGLVSNTTMLDVIHSLKDRTALGANHPYAFVIERMKAFGTVGDHILDTCVWMGRFIQMWGAEDWAWLARKTIVNTLCGDPRAGDKEVRMAVISAFGGPFDALGTKRNPGPLYGVKRDVWSALAVALAYEERRQVDLNRLLS